MKELIILAAGTVIGYVLASKSADQKRLAEELALERRQRSKD